jgi:hypothetical protein
LHRSTGRMIRTVRIRMWAFHVSTGCARISRYLWLHRIHRVRPFTAARQTRPSSGAVGCQAHVNGLAWRRPKIDSTASPSAEAMRSATDTDESNWAWRSSLEISYPLWQTIDRTKADSVNRGGFSQRIRSNRQSDCRVTLTRGARSHGRGPESDSSSRRHARRIRVLDVAVRIGPQPRTAARGSAQSRRPMASRRTEGQWAGHSRRIRRAR